MAADVEAVQPFVGETTFLVLKLDLKRIRLPELQGWLSMPPEAQTAYYVEYAAKLTGGIEQLQSLVGDQPVFVSIGIPVSRTRIPAFAFVRKTSEDNSEKLVNFLKNQLNIAASIRGDYVVATAMEYSDAEPLLSASTTSPETIADALQSVAEYPVQALILPPDHVWRAVRELSPELPPQLGGGSSSVLTEGVQWAALGIDPARLRAELTVRSASAEAARQFASHLPVMLRSVYEAAPKVQHELPPELVQPLIEWLDPQVDQNRVTVRLDGGENTTAKLELLAALANVVEEKTRRRTNQRRLKQILLSMHNYHDTHETFPPADKYRDEGGELKLSWRVHILPYVGEEDLFRQFRLDESWDSDHNRQLIAKMPEVYASNSLDLPPQHRLRPGHTTFLAPTGEGTIFGGAKSTRLGQIRDGTSNTVAVLEVAPEKAVPWTAPQDFEFDPQNPLDGVLIGSDGQWLSAFADGSVRMLPSDLPADIVLHLFQMSDGHVIDIP